MSQIPDYEIFEEKHPAHPVTTLSWRDVRRVFTWFLILGVLTVAISGVAAGLRYYHDLTVALLLFGFGMAALVAGICAVDWFFKSRHRRQWVLLVLAWLVGAAAGLAIAKHFPAIGFVGFFAYFLWRLDSLAGDAAAIREHLQR